MSRRLLGVLPSPLWGGVGGGVLQRITARPPPRRNSASKTRVNALKAPTLPTRGRVGPSARLVLIPRHEHHTSNAGISIQRRSFQLLSPASASCTPLAPSVSVHLNGAPSKRWRMKISHSALKPLSSLAPGPSLKAPKNWRGRGPGGFPPGGGVSPRAWLQHFCSPATAEPKVPSTWKVTRSSRRTRVHQELLMWATTPLASWKVA